MRLKEKKPKSKLPLLKTLASALLTQTKPMKIQRCEPPGHRAIAALDWRRR